MRKAAAIACWHGIAALRLRRGRGGCQPVAAHDLRHLYPVGRAAGCGVDHLGRLAKELRADRRRRNDGQPLHVFGTVVIEPVDRAPRNAERLARPHVDQLAVHGPRQHAVDAIGRGDCDCKSLPGTRQARPCRIGRRPGTCISRRGIANVLSEKSRVDERPGLLALIEGRPPVCPLPGSGWEPCPY